MHRQWWILAAVTLSFFFLNAATFTSLGVELYSMIADLHWSQTEAGLSFSLLGLSCGLSSTLPTWLMKRVGARWTMVLGGITLTLGFALAAGSYSLMAFYLAMILLGTGFTLAGNIPGVYVVASWFPKTSPRMLGIYFMGGAFGSVVGPSLVQAIVQISGNWRIHWVAMAFVAAAVSVICWLCVREAEGATLKSSAVETALPAAGSNGWTYRQALRTRQFYLVAASMTLTLAGLTTIHSVAITHLTQLGAAQAFAAFALSVMALVTTIAKGISGRLCEKVPPQWLLAGGLMLQAIGVVIFAGSAAALPVYVFALTFGAGWGLTFVASNVLVLEYFGRLIGSQVLAMVWMLTTTAAAGPLVAGAIADRFGTFAPIFYLYALLMLIVAAFTAFMGRPVLAGAAAAVEGEAAPAQVAIGEVHA